MRTVVVGQRPVELEALIERRRALGQDLFDEVWEGDYHMVPGPDAWHGVVDDEVAAVLRPLARAHGLVGSGPVNIGDSNNFRVPDKAYHRGQPSGVWLPTAAMVVEVLSPDDETWLKFDHYAAHLVDEICVADPRERRLQWFRRDGGKYIPVERSDLLDVSVGELEAQINWPQ